MRPTRPISHETQCGGAPSGVLDLPGHATEETLDENLHYARAWHRYRYCYRHSEQLRILDAGCGTGRSTVDAARLNPAATVLGVDISEAALALAKGRAGAVGLPTVTFAIQDLATPMPDAWGEFGFVICRNVLGRAADPGTILGQLAKRLSPDGLLLATFPSQVGRQAPRALRQAVDAIAQKNASLAERTRIGMELVQALRPDHPLLNHVA